QQLPPVSGLGATPQGGPLPAQQLPPTTGLAGQQPLAAAGLGAPPPAQQLPPSAGLGAPPTSGLAGPLPAQQLPPVSGAGPPLLPQQSQQFAAGSQLRPNQSQISQPPVSQPPPSSQSSLSQASGPSTPVGQSTVGSLSSSLQHMNLNPSSGAATPITSTFTTGSLPPPKDYRGVAVGLAGGEKQPELHGVNTLLAATGILPSMPNRMAMPFNTTLPSNTSASMFGGSQAAPKLANTTLAGAMGQKVAYGVPPQPVPPAAVAAEQNNINNNNSSSSSTTNNAQQQLPPRLQPQQQQQQQQWLPQPNVPLALPQQQAFVAPPLPKSQPSQALLPPFAPPPTAEKQQQYAYNKQAYAQGMPPLQQQQQQQPPLHPPAAGMFGAQQMPSNAPLQYQTQSAPTSAPLSVAQQGFSRLWGQDTIDLMQNRHILSPATLGPPKVVLHNQFHESINCNPSIIRCTLAKIPESNSLLQKSRLPLGIVIHPFRDVNSLPVIQCMNIVRCRLCRTYINPFVYFVDSKMWKCNLCYRVNELPDDFQFDPATKTYGDVTRRPEVRSSTIEFIAPSEYMLRPPQPAMYLFLFDVSIIAQQSGYLESACSVLNRHLDEMPGDARTQVGFICYDSFVHFYSMAEGLNQPHEMTLLDIDDPFLPRPDSLLVNLKECKELVRDLLKQLPKRFAHTHDPGSSLGAALQVAFKLMQASGGRITVFQSCLPNKGPGSLEPREDPNNRSAKDVAHLNPATDFYKRYALECSGYQIAVDLFLMNQQYSDMATISGVSKHSGGCVHHFPLYQKTKQHMVDSFRQCFKRYLTRKIGFEAVMRIRCTRGLQVHTFHGNFFVRSTDLLSLPNVNPDAGYGMQISYEESLTDVKTICFQAALLYTNSEGERRIRVHTICLPVTSSLPEVMHSADAEAIIGLLSKMAVDRSIASNLSDARDAFINATIDVFNAFKIAQNLPSGQSGQLIAPRSLALLPLYILALLKHPAFRVGTSTRLDDRVYAMDCMKTMPLDQLMKFIYPELYKIDSLIYHARNSNLAAPQDDDDDDEDLPEVPRLQLSAEHLDSRSIFLMDCGTLIMLYVGINVPADVLQSLLGISSTAELADYVYGIPSVASAENDVLKRFILRLNYDKPYAPLVQIIRDTSTAKAQFIERLTDDRSESSLSYYEFLQHIRAQVK
ncbi:hypothetical protein KR222_009732, partial [Zaprionus bogoriensis]